jgi:hypothetical protein
MYIRSYILIQSPRQSLRVRQPSSLHHKALRGKYLTGRMEN